MRVLARRLVGLAIVTSLVALSTRIASAVDDPKPAKSSDQSAGRSLDEAMLNYLKSQAAPHEAVRDRLLSRFKDLRTERNFLQADGVLEEIRKEADFAPANPHLMGGGRHEPGKIGSLGRATIIDAINDDMAVVTTYFEGKEYLVLVRGLKGFTTVCNDCPLELHSVQIKDREKYERVIGERKALGAGKRRDKVVLNQSGQSEESSSEEASATGSRQTGEVTSDEEVVVGVEKKSKKRHKTSGEGDRTHEYEQERVVKLLGPTKDLLSVVPIDLTDAVPAVKNYWDDYRAREKKANEAEASEFYGEMVKLDADVREGRCSVKAKNTTDVVLRDVTVELTSKPNRIKPISLAMSDVAPGRTRTKSESWRLPDAEPKVRVTSLKVAPPPACADCHGTRRVKCPNCMGKLEVKCTACDGKGHKKVTSYEGGKGPIKSPKESLVVCKQCKGGVKTCQVCRKSGEIDCKKCKQKGG